MECGFSIIFWNLGQVSQNGLQVFPELGLTWGSVFALRFKLNVYHLDMNAHRVCLQGQNSLVQLSRSFRIFQVWVYCSAWSFALLGLDWFTVYTAKTSTFRRSTNQQSSDHPPFCVRGGWPCREEWCAMEDHKDEVADIDEAFSDLPRFQEDSKIWHVAEVVFFAVLLLHGGSIKIAMFVPLKPSKAFICRAL